MTGRMARGLEPAAMSPIGGVEFETPGTTSASSDDRDVPVRAAHAAMDGQTASFQVRTGLRCPDGCGQCCSSPNVEASVVDVMPLARALIADGQATRALSRIDEQDDDARCVVFEGDPLDSSRGRCTMYEHRPSICRLFGFAGRRDADGAPQFTPCRVHVQTMPEIAMAAVAAVRTGEVSLPIFTDLAAPIAAIDPGPRGQLRPINDALREALQSEMLAMRFAVDESNDDDQDKPRTPSRPQRKAA